MDETSRRRIDPIGPSPAAFFARAIRSRGCSRTRRVVIRYIIVDLEATCWPEVRDPERMEIIEIGAIELHGAGGPPGREFAAFVRPAVEPTLSDFCRRLTTIRQKDVDQADTFPATLARFLSWIGDEPFVLGSWGGYDLSQFQVDCTRHGIALPRTFERHINLKQEFARLFGVKPCGLPQALARVGLTLAGTHHRGIDDARNIADLACLILPRWEELGKIPQIRA